MYVFKDKMGIRTHSLYDPYFIIGQLVNRQFQAIRGQILPIRIQSKEEWILLTGLFFTYLVLIISL